MAISSSISSSVDTMGVKDAQAPIFSHQFVVLKHFFEVLVHQFADPGGAQ